MKSYYHYHRMADNKNNNKEEFLDKTQSKWIAEQFAEIAEQCNKGIIRTILDPKSKEKCEQAKKDLIQLFEMFTPFSVKKK